MGWRKSLVGLFDGFNMKNFVAFFLLLFLIFGLWACSDYKVNLSNAENWETPINENFAVKDSIHKGMVVIFSKGKSVKLGTKDSKATMRERPQMKVKFTYDFSLDRHEVTHEEFASIMGGEADAENRFKPIRGLTYFDAVMYANKKSISEGYDTAYTYTGINRNNFGNIINLENFAFHPEVNAYRLPTEAEWTYAASLDFSAERSWNSENSDYDIHDVCTIGQDTAGLCDMAGNVKEWVNDWLGYFRDTTIENYVGAPDGGNLAERVLKGGSFRDDVENINLYSREDEYTVTSSMYAEYVGYRLAFGAIPDAVWLSANGVASTNRISPVASAMSVRYKTGTFQTKLVFRNDVTHNLAYVDYSNGALSVVEIGSDIDAYHPDISPDGSKVAFCTKEDGVAGTSELYVRDLNPNGTNLVKLNVESAAIPRWRLTENGDTVIVYITDCGGNNDTLLWKSHSTWQVKFANGKFGTPEKLFDGTYNGGVSVDNSLAISSVRLLRARMSDKDSLWYGGEQVCNASLSTDGTNRTLFLDFGGLEDGTRYRQHERLLVADSVGKLIQKVSSPSGYKFDGSEWVKNSNLVVATLTNSSGKAEKITLLNLADSSMLTLAEGEGLILPCLWVNSSTTVLDDSEVNADSAGMYYSENLPYYAVELRVKMENMWVNRDSVTAAAFGSSRMMFGLFEKNIAEEKMLNMAYSSGDLHGANYLLKNYVINHVKKLKYVVLEVSPDMFWHSSEDYFSPILNNTFGYTYDENHDFWKDGVPDGFVEIVKDVPKPVSVLLHPYDFETFLLPSTSWDSPLVVEDTTAMSLDDEIVKTNISIFDSIIAVCQKHKVTVIALVVPRHAGYKDTGAYGMYGPKRSVTKKLFDLLQKKDVVWMDENNWGDHEYTDDAYGYNMDHLSYLGAYRLTEKVNDKLKELNED